MWLYVACGSKRLVGMHGEYDVQTAVWCHTDNNDCDSELSISCDYVLRVGVWRGNRGLDRTRSEHDGQIADWFHGFICRHTRTVQQGIHALAVSIVMRWLWQLSVFILKTTSVTLCLVWAWIRYVFKWLDTGHLIITAAACDATSCYHHRWPQVAKALWDLFSLLSTNHSHHTGDRHDWCHCSISLLVPSIVLIGGHVC